jgi:iron complex outermembrane receptor protein
LFTDYISYRFSKRMAIQFRVAILLCALLFVTIQTGSGAIEYCSECDIEWENTFIQVQPRSVISGRIMDAQSNIAIGWATILVIETGRNTTAHEDGAYTLSNLSAGEYTLRVQRIGYEPLSRRVQLGAGDTLHLDFQLRTSSFRSRAIEVVADRVSGSEVQVQRRLDGKELRQQLGRTLAETLQNEPGMSQSSMGPAPARPVLRGLSGDRLMVLEDGRTTGDISTSSPDHALAIDPINSNHIEILRGPASLIYTSNALGGVVNVVRGQIPTETPDHFHGSGSIQGETVNSGVSFGVLSFGSIKNYGIRGDLGIRNASNIQTPEGKLNNTAINNYHGSLGISKIEDWGLLGISTNIYRSGYGIPGDFLGSHPNGVKINLEREQADIRFDRTLDSEYFRRMLIEYTFSHYFHEELEMNSRTGKFDLVGSDYSLFTNTFNGRFYLDKFGIINRSILGLQAEQSNFAAGGLTFTPETNEFGLAIYSYQQINHGNWSVQTGLRYDFATVRPVRESQTAYGLRRQRDFSNLSGGISAVYKLSNPLSSGVSIMRTVRIPGVEELFTEGPHLPAYSFEVGNPNIGEEVGLGVEWNLRYATDRFAIQNAWYVNTFSNYLYPRNTGEFSVRRPLPIYQITGDEVLMWGTEILMEVQLNESFSLNGTVSYVEGTITETDRPLPFIPPLIGKLNFQYNYRGFIGGLSTRFASNQSRLGEFEEPTDGYQIFDASIQYIFNQNNFLHTFSISVENFSNESYRMHLSRVKSIMPEPGRNLKILYRVYF